MPATIDGDPIEAVTIDGDPVSQITADGDVVWSASPGTLIASFEGAEFDDAWGGRKDTVDGDLTTSSARAVDGDRSLYHDGADGYDSTISAPGDGLPHYVGVPSKQRFYLWASDWANTSAYWFFCRRNSGNDALYLRFWGSQDAFFFGETVDGVTSTIARDDTAGMPPGEWLEITITVNGEAGTTYAGLQALEPMVEVYTVDNSFNRQTEVSTFQGDEGAGDQIAISQSNALAPGEGGYEWAFQDTSDVYVDHHHLVEN